MKNIAVSALFAMGILIFGANRSSAQGSLTPPAGAPAATMKSLAQIEPRTPIDATHTPGDTLSLYNITQPGSYYLTTNLLAVGGKNGIAILTNDVSIDLGGFALIGNGSTNSVGITCFAYLANLSVKNGNLRNWGAGGIILYFRNAKFENLRLDNNGAYGLYSYDVQSQISHCTAGGFTGIGFLVSNGGLITDCTADGNNGSTCFDGGENCVFTRCVAEDGGTGFSCGLGSSLNSCADSFSDNGFQPSPYCTLRDCSALFCNTNGVDAGSLQGEILIGFNAGNCSGTGIVVGDDATITSCGSTYNVANGIMAGAGCTITGCTANRNGFGAVGIGIYTGIRATIANCTANQNQSDGIRLNGDSMVTGCHASNNGLGVSAAGIHTFGSGSRIDGNHARDNVGTGILASSSDVIVRNTVGGSTTAYNPASGSNFAPIQTPAAATNPMANISF